ncbi:MAG: hypothetical protein JSS09_09635 [Verrucomicrobia bacterium]|nr:hypothetical protein [Verrucomicrobiota bacterium]
MMIICLFKSMRLIASAFQTSEDLLLNMLPSSIVDRFKKGEETVIDEYKASVLFVQIDHLEDSFSSDTMSAIFDQLDALVEKFRVEKIQVVGESQVIVSGIPAPIKDHEILLADFALELKKQIEDFNQDKGFSLHIRMGMSSGTVIAGFVGDKKFVYDLWGDVVTLANALESCSVAGEIQISESMAHILGNSFELEERGVIELPELGSLKTYFLKERKMGSKSFL